MALAALRERIGHPVFAHLLRAWATEHYHGHGTTGRFEALASRLSGQDLTSFFGAWVRQATKPPNTPGNGL
jgi:aminopeptidase N